MVVVGWGLLRFFFFFSVSTCPVGPTALVAGAKGTVCFPLPLLPWGG